MLDVFKEKIINLPDDIQSKITILNSNMTDFKLPKKYSLIIAPFHVFQLLTNENDIKNCLNCIKEHLVSNGVFIVNVFRPEGILNNSWCSDEKIQWEQFDPKTGNHVVKKDVRERIDTKNQILFAWIIYEITNKKGNTERIIEELELKYYYYEQLKTLLIENYFIITEEYGWYDKSEIQTGRELIFVCRSKGTDGE